MRRYVVSRVGTNDGPDIAAQVFVVAFQQRGGYRTEYPEASPWLYGIARNLLKAHWKKAGRRRVKEQEAASRNLPPPSGWSEDVDSRIDADRAFDTVRSALDRLPMKLKEPLLLHCWEELGYEEISLSMGIPVGTVRSRISRARKKIAELTAASGQSLYE